MRSPMPAVIPPEDKDSEMTDSHQLYIHTLEWTDVGAVAVAGR